jgi:IS1 family transposase
MIQETRTYRCRRCGSVDIVQNGRNRYGNQQYHCKACGAYGVLEPKVRYTEAQKEQILRAYQERVRLRVASAVWGLHRDGPEVDSKKAASLPPVAETLRPAEGGDVLEVSWGGRTGRSGCRRTRQVVACVVGDRREATGRRLWEAIPEAYRGCRSYSDFWAAYASVFPQPTHRSVDKQSGQLAHIERWHNTVRQRLARYVWKTLSFSKSLAFHKAVTRWFVTDYNLGLLPSVTS